MDTKINSSNPQMTFTPPKVGVVDVPRISKTPIKDTIELKEKENTQQKLNIKKKKGSIDIINYLWFLVSAIAATVGITSIFKK